MPKMMKPVVVGCISVALAVAAGACGKPGQQVNAQQQAPVAYAGQPAGDGRTLLVPGSELALDHVGVYAWKSDPIPGVKRRAFGSFGFGRVIEGGSAVIVDEQFVPLDTPKGLVLSFTFTVESITGNPVLRITRGHAMVPEAAGA